MTVCFPQESWVKDLQSFRRMKLFMLRLMQQPTYLCRSHVMHPSIIAYERIYGEEKMLVVCNFYKTEVVWDSGMDLKGFETLLGNYSEQKIEESKISLKPYEAMMLYRKR